MARQRDYKAEYARRKARAAASGRRRDYAAEYRARVRRLEAEGLSRSAARGHPRAGEVGAAEWGQLRRAAAIPSPSGWRDEDGVMTRGAPWGPDPLRRAAADRLAEIAGVRSPTTMGRGGRLSAVGREAFVELFVSLGLGSRNAAYTLWFSP